MKFLPREVRAFIDRWTDPHHLCLDCSEPASRWLELFRLGSTAIALEPEFSESVVCVECLRDWYRITLGRDLSETTAEARRLRTAVQQDAQKNRAP